MRDIEVILWLWNALLTGSIVTMTYRVRQIQHDIRAVQSNYVRRTE